MMVDGLWLKGRVDMTETTTLFDRLDRTPLLGLDYQSLSGSASYKPSSGRDALLHGQEHERYRM